MLILTLLVAPMLMGILLVDTKSFSVLKTWVYGQLMLWALFQVVAVPFILWEKNLSELLPVYLVVCSIFIGCGSIQWIRNRKAIVWKPSKSSLPRTIFILLLVIQCIAMIVLAINDGDDAYYMAIASIAESGGSMYTANPYAVGTVILNPRYALAPFPIWIASLSRVTGVHVLSLGHIYLGIVSLLLCYGIYHMMGKLLFEKNRKYLDSFMLFISVLILWGNTSSRTAESFLLIRSRQGKSLVSAIVIPMIFYLLILMGKQIHENQKMGLRYYLIATAVLLTACLGSSMGSALGVVLFLSGAFLLTLAYKRYQILLLSCLCAIPSGCYILAYLIL